MSSPGTKPSHPRTQSPFIRYLGVQSLDRPENAAAAQVVLRAELLNNGSTAHGGLIVTLADTAMAQSVVKTCGADGLVATVDMNISFVGVGKDALLCEAKCIHFTGSLAFCEATVTDVHGSLVARSSATFKRTRRPAGA